MDDDLAHRILEVGIQIPKGLLRRLRQHCHSEDSREYTAQALKTLQKHFGFVPKTLRVTELKSDRDRDQAVPVIRREHIRADAYMSETVADWLTPNEHGVAEIVFDGILEDPLRRPVSEGVHKVSHLRSLATCAFLQWMIGEWPEPYRIAGGTLREIRFLTGTFQTLDVAGHDAFLNRWVGYLKRDCSALKAVALIRVARIEVSSVQSGTPGVGLAPDDAALVVDGARVPFVAKALPNVPERSDWNDLDMTYRLDRFLSKAPARQITYAKRDLVEMFSEYTKFTQAQRLDPRVETVVQRVIAVNSFRDAFKADVALARGAVYLTVDRLALVYYELRRRAQRADSRGLSLLTGDKDGGMIVLGAYSS
jgi:hypothetical protein